MNINSYMNTNFLHCIKMSEKTLNFGNVVVNKREFHASKKGNCFKFNIHRSSSNI